MATRVAIVGLGRIGLPLALSFADRGLEVIGVDREPRVLDLVAEGRMPFQETGTQELLDRVLPSGRLGLTQRIQDAEDAFVAHVPERIAVNHFLEEIATLPCIVGGVGAGSGASAAQPFEVFGTEIVQTTPVQAELAKIWTNILRYAQFALPNLLMMECEQYGANVFEVIDLINRDYPRGGIARPGLTAGTCLRKDFAFSEERSRAPGMLLAVSRIHETVPLFLVEGLKRRLGGSLRDRKVAVLGLTFKRDSDDVRDSLSFKLIRLLERELADVARYDPHLPDQSEPLESVLAEADAVVVATNHSDFEDL